MHFSWAMDLDPKGANSQIKDALDPTLNRAGQEEASLSTTPSATVPPNSTTFYTPAPSMDDSPTINVVQPVTAQGSNSTQRNIATEQGSDTSIMHQPALDIELIGNEAIARSRGIGNLEEREDQADLLESSNRAHLVSETANINYVGHSAQDGNILNVANEEEIISPTSQLYREPGSLRARSGNLDRRQYRQHPRHIGIDLNIADDNTETQEISDSPMEG